MAILDYLALQDAVLGRRFPQASNRESSKRWLDTAYADVWNALRGDLLQWTFELVFRSDLALMGGDSTPVMPVDYADTTTLYSNAGVELTRFSPEQFEFEFADAFEPGSPYAFTVIDRQIYLGPTPAGNATFKHSYRRRMSHKNAGGAVVAGPMSLDDDLPLWDDHHSVLIPRAYALGLVELNDPTWEQAQNEYERQLSRMKEDYEQTRPQKQWATASWW